ncbi:MAG: T9SS type A sorting domain-containing protein [Melioribacteraceae bacterium]
MKKFYSMFIVLSGLLFTTNIFAQAASVTWALNNTTQLIAVNVGNVTGSAESISSGSGRFGMSVLDYNADGQRLWEGTAGWIAGTEEATRYIQFDALFTIGNSFKVTNVSFNYGAAGIDHNIQSNAYYSTDGWVTRTLLNPSPLAYPGSGMSPFTKDISVTIASGSIFSVRIYPYSIVNSSPMSPTFAVHNNVIISGTTAAKKNCVIQVTNATGKWGKSVLLTAKLFEPGLMRNTDLPNQELKFYKISPGTREGDTVDNKYIGSGLTDANGVATIAYTIPQDSVSSSMKAPQDSVTHTIKAEFAGDAFYSAQSGTGKLTVVRHVTSLSVPAQSGIFGQTVTLVATLTDNDNNGKGIPNQVLQFSLKGILVGSATTDASGVARRTTNSSQSADLDAIIMVSFAGDANYSPKSGTGKLTITLVGVEKNQLDIPTKFDLSQNYPNPFNPTTTIKYDIPKSGFVTISVYDILGREIKVLVNEQKSPGHYQIIFDAKNLASGIYFYTIRTAGFTQIKKMILVK